MIRTRTATRTGPSHAITLVIALIGFLTLPMSMSGAGVALPAIGSELEASGGAVQWVVTGYFVTAASFMLVAGSLGDTRGRRFVFRTGAVVYAVGSIAASFAPTIGLLLVARILSGMGAAGVMAGGAAILGTAFTGPARTRAFAAMGTVAGIGLAVGPALAGWLIEAFGWRASFGIFGLTGILLVLGSLRLPESRAAALQRIDWQGAACLVIGMASTLLAISQGAERGWFRPAIIGSALLGAAALTVFVVRSSRVPNPILHLGLLRNRGFVGWLLAAATTAIGFAGILGFLPSYLQSAGGLDPSLVGSVLLLPSLPMLIMPAIGSRLINRGIHPTAVIAAALLMIAAGNGWLTVLHPGMEVSAVAGPLIAIGIGVGTANGIIDAQAMNTIGHQHLGVAAGLLNTVRSGTNAANLALFGAALLALLAQTLPSDALAGAVATGGFESSDLTLADRLTSAWRIVQSAIGILCAAAAAAVTVLLVTSPDSTPRPQLRTAVRSARPTTP